MAGTTLHTDSTPVTAAELLEQGFTVEIISDLKILRDAWNPAAEQVESMLEWRRMQFARWLYENGHFTEEVTG
ncbi:MAG: hypothetical protein R2849_22130 [Thermomicrobiales bacterium]